MIRAQVCNGVNLFQSNQAQAGLWEGYSSYCCAQVTLILLPVLFSWMPKPSQIPRMYSNVSCLLCNSRTAELRRLCRQSPTPSTPLPTRLSTTLKSLIQCYSLTLTFCLSVICIKCVTYKNKVSVSWDICNVLKAILVQNPMCNVGSSACSKPDTKPDSRHEDQQCPSLLFPEGQFSTTVGCSPMGSFLALLQYMWHDFLSWCNT